MNAAVVRENRETSYGEVYHFTSPNQNWTLGVNLLNQRRNAKVSVQVIRANCRFKKLSGRIDFLD